MHQFLNQGQPNQQTLITSYGYDELGNRISQTDAEQRTTSYAYDKLGRRTKRTLPLNQFETYTYFDKGNLKTRTDFNGRTTTYAYDTLNRLQSKTADTYFTTGACAGGLCGAGQISFTYFNDGQRKTMTDQSGTTNYTYYPLTGRLHTKQTPQGTLTYAYDNAGNLKSVVSSNASGVSVTYDYDELNRLKTATDASGSTQYQYDPVGNLDGPAREARVSCAVVTELKPALSPDSSRSIGILRFAQNDSSFLWPRGPLCRGRLPAAPRVHASYSLIMYFTSIHLSPRF